MKHRFLLVTTGKFRETGYEIVNGYIIDEQYQVVKKIEEVWDKGEFSKQVQTAFKKYDISTNIVDHDQIQIFMADSFDEALERAKLHTIFGKEEPLSPEESELLDRAMARVTDKYNLHTTVPQPKKIKHAR